MLNIKNINLVLDKTPLLNNINIDFTSGEILGITGPASCGKSTLVKILSGILKPTNGTIELNKKNLDEFSRNELRKHISFLTTKFQFNPEATVFEEIIKGRINFKKKFNPYSDYDRETTAALMDEIGISEQAEKRMKTLPDSFIKISLIARTLNTETDIIALDSPDSGLDPAQKNVIIRTIKKYVMKGDKVVIIASSDIDFLVKLCDRMIILKDGTIIEQGSPSIITEELIKKVFRINSLIVKNIVTGFPEIHVIDIN